MFDLETLDTTAAQNTAQPMQPRNPVTGELATYKDDEGVERPVRIWYKGLDSDAGRAKKRALQNKRLKKLDAGKRIKHTVEQSESETIEILVELCEGWEGIQWQKQPLEFSKANARMIHSALVPLVEQAQEFVADAENYAGKSSAA